MRQGYSGKANGMRLFRLPRRLRMHPQPHFSSTSNIRYLGWHRCRIAPTGFRLSDGFALPLVDSMVADLGFNSHKRCVPTANSPFLRFLSFLCWSFSHPRVPGFVCLWILLVGSNFLQSTLPSGLVWSCNLLSIYSLHFQRQYPTFQSHAA